MASGTMLTVLLSILGTGGIAGSIAALRKVPTDRNTAVVQQAQVAAGEWEDLARFHKEEARYWRQRALSCERAHGEPELRDDQPPPRPPSV